MIPKVIHYIWLGDDMPILYKECISTWKQYAPGFKIEFWDEDRVSREFELDNFYYQMIRKKKYAFAVDYLRCLVLYEYGGIYLDTDMELVKDITPLCDNMVFSGLEKENQISCGIIGAQKKHPLMKNLMERVISDGGLNVMPKLFTDMILEQNIELKWNNDIHIVNEVTIYPTRFFYPFNPYRDGEVSQLLYKHIDADTYAIHHWAKAWSLSFWELVIRRLKKILGK